MISLNVTKMWSPQKEIKYVKEALKQDFLYNDEELRRLKRRLRDLYKIKHDMTRGDGFGNGGAPVIDLTQQALQTNADEAVETLNQLDKAAF